MTEPAFSIRETASCPHCHLHQYTTNASDDGSSANCRRCGQPLGITYYRFPLAAASAEHGVPDRQSIQRTLGALIRRLRLRRHLSQELLAGRMAIHRTTITRVEGGQLRSLAIVLRAAAALDLEVDAVLVRVHDRRLVRR